MSKSICVLTSILLFIQNSALINATKVNINDINSIYGYFDKIASKAIDDYEIDSRLTTEVNKRTLNIMFDDKNRVFNELSNISMNLKYYHSNKNWTRVMRLMENYEYQKIAKFNLYDLFSRENELSELRRRIEAATNAFKFVGRLEEFNNAENFCAEVYPVANFFLEPLHRESLSEIYSDFMKMVRHQIIAIKKKTPNIAVFLRASFHDYYQLMMVVQMKLIGLKFFNSLTERRCRNEGYHINSLHYSYWPRFALKETQQIMKETLKTVKSLNCYADDCEKNKKRRYKWFEDANATVHNNNKTCHETITILNEYESLDDNCGYCLCTCVSKQLRSPYMTTAISFRDQISDIYNDMVVTGLRFVEKDDMIHMQIMEGQLFMNGRGHLNRWKPLEKFDFDQNTGMYYVENGIDMMTPLSSGVDYGHPETMNLDYVVAPTGYVITGVRFRVAEDSIDNPLLGNGPVELQIRVTPFDSVHRKLSDIHQLRWVASQSLRERKFVKFDFSDFQKDVGESTVSFIDGRTVKSGNFAPIRSIGIRHRRNEGHYGRLGFQIFSV